MTAAITQLTQSYWNQQPTLIPSFIETIDQFASSMFSLPVVQATDVGMIGYFEDECPNGWDSYQHFYLRECIKTSDDSATNKEAIYKINNQINSLESELDTLKNMKITIWRVIRDTIGF